jgi:hypothetical protein
MENRNHNDRISRQAFLRTLALAAPFLSAAALSAEPEQAGASSQTVPDPANLRAFVEMARSDIRMQKAFVLAQNLPLTEAEAMDFWPLQREYNDALNKLLDERVAGIVQFAKDHGAMTDAQATTLAKTSFDLEEKRTALKRKYFSRFCKVIPPLKAARFFQIENQLNMAIDLQIAASLPLIK